MKLWEMVKRSLLRLEADDAETWIRTRALKVACGGAPGICENPGHHMLAMEIEDAMTEAYKRGKDER